MNKIPHHLPGLQALATRYDAFCVDQFGVLHDGQRAYPGAAAALAGLKAAGRPVVVLSNSGRSGEYNAARIARLGIAPALFDAVVTSGDIARALLDNGELGVAADCRYLAICSAGDDDPLAGRGPVAVPHGAQAELVWIGGSQGEAIGLEGYRRLLQPAAARGALGLCTNPDRHMLTPTGPQFGAGQIAALYQHLGGKVVWVGKPYPQMFARAAQVLGICDTTRMACIGDSIEHDIAGAQRVGAGTVLVRTGIHAGCTDAALQAEMQRWNAVPDVILPALSW